MEKLAVEVPVRAHYIRVIIAELQRIASHLVWLGTHALDIGAMTIFFYCFREREMILDLFEAFCGARLTYNAFRIGGILDDVPPGWVDRVRHFMKIFPPRQKEYEELLTENRIWLGRTKGVGLLSTQDAIDVGVTGPLLRASGVDYDIRKANPYSAYDQFEFDVPHGRRRHLRPVPGADGGDAPVAAGSSSRRWTGCRRARSAPRCRTASSRRPARSTTTIEGPRGEQGFYIVSEGGETPYRMRLPGPVVRQPAGPSVDVARRPGGRRRRRHRHHRHRAGGSRPVSQTLVLYVIIPLDPDRRGAGRVSAAWPT